MISLDDSHNSTLDDSQSHYVGLVVIVEICRWMIRIREERYLLTVGFDRQLKHNRRRRLMLMKVRSLFALGFHFRSPESAPAVPDNRFRFSDGCDFLLNCMYLGKYGIVAIDSIINMTCC
ncbi:hypothetical protein L1987_60159 [Smallanthus sonchifolius]|uniref:Uncharacterized protein n=1 Tax=Smallanthus sonchifolius TaxID=185202 RepID=A0ACB9D7P9_9ASTR|nr:hypothetical protein L1987_60159 [Smallanthus sonchifolius]